MHTFCRPGNLNLARRRASMTAASCWSLLRIERIGCPMLTRATVPCGLPKAPLIPVCKLHNNDYHSNKPFPLTDQHQHMTTFCLFLSHDKGGV